MELIIQHALQDIIMLKITPKNKVYDVRFMIGEVNRYKNILKSCFLGHIFYQSGFTLIELIVVFTVFTILSGVGVASFVTYSRSQAVDNSLKELKTTLLTARSRSLSQLKGTNCGNNVNLQLLGYEVVLCSVPGHSHPANVSCNDSSNAYELQIICGLPDGSGQTAVSVLDKKFLDSSITFDTNSTATYFYFSTLTGAVTTDASGGTSPTAKVKGYSLTRSVSVSQTGVIQ